MDLERLLTKGQLDRIPLHYRWSQTARTRLGLESAELGSALQPPHDVMVADSCYVKVYKDVSPRKKKITQFQQSAPRGQLQEAWTLKRRSRWPEKANQVRCHSEAPNRDCRSCRDPCPYRKLMVLGEGLLQ